MIRAETRTFVIATPPSAADARAPLSIVVPVTERPEALVPLYREFSAPLRASGRAFEFIFAVAPWYRQLVPELRALADTGEPVRVIESAREGGETHLLRLGASEARGNILLTLPAYRQVTPDVLLTLVRRIESGDDFAVAHRWPRRDPWLNRLQNRLLHLIVGRMARGCVHDVGCGVRAMRRESLAEIPLYGDFARFLPLLALHHGFGVTEISTPQHDANLSGRMYSPGVYFRRLLDTVGLLFLLRFTEKPLRFFGLLGGSASAAGAALLLVLLVQRLGGSPIAGRPLLLAAVVLVTLGIQITALGLVGEMIVHFSASRRRTYRLRHFDGEQDR